MISFEDNITGIIKDMEKQKENQFPLQENVLKYGLFDDDAKEKIKDEINKIKVKVNTDINKENDFYMNKTRQAIKDFEENDIEKLNNIILDLDVFFSREKLKNFADMFEIAYNSILEKMSEEIIHNEKLAKKYFDEFVKVIDDNNYIKNLINNRYTIDSWIYSGGWRDYKYIEYLNILDKKTTSGYLLKYNTYKANFEYAKKYLKENFCSDIINIYKTVLAKIKEDLQTIRNHKMTEKYPDFPEFEFYNNNIRVIDKLFTKFNDFLSNDKFNSKFVEPMNNLKENNSSYVTSIENYINNKHEKLKKLNSYKDDFNDFCIDFNRKVCYGCTN